jgi:hypothetical protein
VGIDADIDVCAVPSVPCNLKLRARDDGVVDKTAAVIYWRGCPDAVALGQQGRDEQEGSQGPSVWRD